MQQPSNAGFVTITDQEVSLVAGGRTQNVLEAFPHLNPDIKKASTAPEGIELLEPFHNTQIVMIQPVVYSS